MLMTPYAMRLIPHNIQTCWNSTYDMLQFSLQYKDGVKTMTLDLLNGLQKYELRTEEWLVVKELDGTLKVLSHLDFSVLYPPLLSPYGIHGMGD